MDTRPGITQPPLAACAGRLIQKTENKNTNQIISRQDYHFTQPSSEGKSNKQTNKNSAQISPYMKLTQATGPTLESGNQKEEGILPKHCLWTQTATIPWSPACQIKDLGHHRLKASTIIDQALSLWVGALTPRP